MLLTVRTCALVFHITCTMIGGNITNHSLEKKKSALLQFIKQQNTFLALFLALDNFVRKVFKEDLQP